MELLTAPDDVELLAAKAPAAPELRVRQRGDQRFRTVAISPGKCTIGSSPQCQVCLPAPDVKPLQCLITIEANEALATRWAAGVQLNGNDFSKAKLRDGDRLTIGEWDIEFAKGVPPAIADVQSESLPASSQSVAPAALLATAICASSHAFADGLVLQLWMANHEARRRAKGLVAGIRAARFHVDAMAADMSAMETELDLARAACDSQLVDNDRMNEDLVERLRDHEQRSSEFATLQVARPAIDPDLVKRVEELEAAVAAKAQQHEQLACELESSQLERIQLAERVHERDEQIASLSEEHLAVRFQLEEANDRIGRQASDYDQLTAECFALQTVPPTMDPELVQRADELETAVAAQARQLEQLTCEREAARLDQVRLAELYRVEAERSERLERSLAEHQAQLAAAAAMSAPVEAIMAPPEQASATDGLWQDAVSVEEPSPADGLVSSSANAEAEPLPACDASDAVEPAPEFSPPSFIDQYRHLLEERVDPLPGTLAPGGTRPVIDDEFLSPAKAETCASPNDDSDEALESYMASMMRRVRSSAPSYESSQAEVGPDDFKEVDSHLIGSRTLDGDSSEAPAAAEFLAEEPFTFEAVKHATRKPALASDLTALRELANNSARTAIATHAHQRSRESAMTKVAIALTAAAATAYLFISAPAIGAWQVWAGAATGAVGLTAAVQILLMKRRGVKK